MGLYDHVCTGHDNMTEVKGTGKVEVELVVRDKDGKIKYQETVKEKEHGNHND